MKFEDKSENQHYIAQVEQKLNSINPNAKKEKRRIYKLKVKDRNNSIIKNTEENGVKIENNLSRKDLYTFNFLEDGVRENFEDFFKNYENNIENHIKNMKKKCNDGYQDITLEVVNVFLYKLMNIIRNPYFIKETIAIFEDLLEIDISEDNDIIRVMNFTSKGKDKIYKEYNITADDYKKWLIIIYLAITKKDGEELLLESIVRNIFNNKDYHKDIWIFFYDDKFCLLSDKGFNLESIGDGNFILEFNLRKDVFISFPFFSSYYMFNLMKQELGASDEYIQEVLSVKKILNKDIKARKNPNKIEALSKYNQRTIQNCHEHVFGASKEYEGVTVFL